MPLLASFPCEADVPVDAFREAFKAELAGSGFGLGSARLFDFSARLGGAHIFLRVVTAANGIRVDAKIKPALFGDACGAERAIGAAVRAAGRRFDKL